MNGGQGYKARSRLLIAQPGQRRWVHMEECSAEVVRGRRDGSSKGRGKRPNKNRWVKGIGVRFWASGGMGSAFVRNGQGGASVLGSVWVVLKASRLAVAAGAAPFCTVAARVEDRWVEG